MMSKYGLCPEKASPLHCLSKLCSLGLLSAILISWAALAQYDAAPFTHNKSG